MSQLTPKKIIKKMETDIRDFGAFSEEGVLLISNILIYKYV